MYKTFIKQIKDGKIIGTACLTEDYETLTGAMIAGRENRLTPESKFCIRKYDDTRNVNIISDDDNDTGIIVMDYNET